MWFTSYRGFKAKHLRNEAEFNFVGSCHFCRFCDSTRDWMWLHSSLCSIHRSRDWSLYLSITPLIRRTTKLININSDRANHFHKIIFKTISTRSFILSVFFRFLSLISNGWKFTFRDFKIRVRCIIFLNDKLIYGIQINRVETIKWNELIFHILSENK